MHLKQDVAMAKPGLRREPNYEEMFEHQYSIHIATSNTKPTIQEHTT